MEQEKGTSVDRPAVAAAPPDSADRRILRELQKDGRLSNTRLAERVGLSAAACWQRTRRLFETGVIRAVRAQVDPASVDRRVLVVIGVVLDRSTPDSFAQFEQAVAALDEILDCHLVAGEVDYFLRVRMRDLAAFNRFHADTVISLPGVRQVRTFFVLNEVKSDAPLSF